MMSAKTELQGCYVQGCGRRQHRRGMCGEHYQRWWKYGDAEGRPERVARLCSIDDCGQPYYAKGWCRNHHARWVRHGDPLTLLKPQARRGEPARYLDEIVLQHTANECLLWPYGRDSNGYGQVTEGRVHVIVCERIHGPAPTPDHEVAHECGKGHEGCCAPLHLAWKTHAENMADMFRHGTNKLCGNRRRRAA
jgi:hypothetical protein